MELPIVAVSESSEQQNWFVFGPDCQVLLGPDEGRKLAKALKPLHKTKLIKDQGCYWLELEQDTLLVNLKV